MSANICIYGKFNAPPQQQGTSRAREGEVKKWYSLQNVAYSRSFAYIFRFVYSFWCRLSFLFWHSSATHTHTIRTQHALICSHSFTRVIIHTWHGYGHLIRSFHSSHLARSLRLFAMLPSRSGTRPRSRHTIAHSSTRVPFASHRVCVYVRTYVRSFARSLVQTYYIYIHFLLRRFYLIKIHNTREDISFDFFLFFLFVQPLLTFSFLAIQLLL